MATAWQTSRVAATVHGRVLWRPAPVSGAGGAPLLLGFHGYGESAESSLAALAGIPGAEAWHLAAIQALNRFYTRSGDVVASWMTSQDRELAIADNVAYVERALAALRADLAVGERVVVAGFSQGTAMAWRAAALAVEGCDGVIVLGGDLPAELAEVAWRSRPRALLGRGTADTWYTAEKLETDLAGLAALGLEAESVRFEGGHEWTPAFYEACGRFLAALRVARLA
jgi:predicted esterase